MDAIFTVISNSIIYEDDFIIKENPNIENCVWPAVTVILYPPKMTKRAFTANIKL